MKPSSLTFSGLAAALSLLLVPVRGTESPASSLKRSQVIDLTKGWNAVFLEVAPADSDPEQVFAGLPVDMAAVFFQGAASSEQYITNPDVNLAKAKGWGIWFAKERPEAFLSSLGAVYGQQAYLIHSKAATRWTLTGTVTPAQVRWRPDAFNFVGFSVRAQGAPTFAEFFASAGALRQQPVYRLVNEVWKRVTQFDAESMRSGEAFWIYCNGQSDYQGPLGLELPSRQGLILASGPGSVILRNLSGFPISATVEHVGSGGNELPLSMLMTVYGDPANPVKSVSVAKPSGPWVQELPPLEAGKAVTIPFECRSSEMTAPSQTALVKITSDIGTETWLPIYGSRADLAK